ncbi:MAG: hypothetical protein AMJ69_03535 [Gammaproteobacteria bacterium SG8_47]|nr:MAG: hypothetical protein AMJ69_03535 [Gammaproteobacteria bacterium SG8_47]
MGKPKKQELETALDAAKRLRETGQDKYFLGKALLNLHYRMSFLEKVMEVADRYLHSGLSEQEHTRLMRAIEAAKRADARSSGEEEQLPELI